MFSVIFLIMSSEPTIFAKVAKARVSYFGNHWVRLLEQGLMPQLRNSNCSDSYLYDLGKYRDDFYEYDTGKV